MQLDSLETKSVKFGKKKPSMALKILSLFVLLSLLFVALYTMIPFYYLGKFNVDEYRKYIDIDAERTSLKNVGQIDNAIQAYKATDRLLTSNNISSKIKDNSFYIIRFDKEQNIWMITLWYKYSIIDDVLYEGKRIFIDHNGYVLGIFTGI